MGERAKLHLSLQLLPSASSLPQLHFRSGIRFLKEHLSLVAKRLETAGLDDSLMVL